MKWALVDDQNVVVAISSAADEAVVEHVFLIEIEDNSPVAPGWRYDPAEDEFKAP
jgi:hypothetical protein